MSGIGTRKLLFTAAVDAVLIIKSRVVKLIVNGLLKTVHITASLHVGVVKLPSYLNNFVILIHFKIIYGYFEGNFWGQPWLFTCKNLQMCNQSYYSNQILFFLFHQKEQTLFEELYPIQIPRIHWKIIISWPKLESFK